MPKKCIIALFSALLLISPSLYAAETGNNYASSQQQKRMITGTVTDVNGEPIIGATVVEQGSANGVITDIDGKFSITVSPNATLEISYIGFQTLLVKVGTSNTLNATLVEAAQVLDEVVVVGYGTMRKSDVTGSISVAKGDELVKAQNFSPLDNLRGKASGVMVLSNSDQPGEYAPKVIIRGAGTINASTNPLYVVDGVVMENFALLNPNDIDRIEILKDASATAIYGARGANGVLLVTTKGGLDNEQGTKVSYAGSVSIANPASYMDVMNAQEWCDAFIKGLENENAWQADSRNKGVLWNTDPKYWFTDSRYFDSNGRPLYDTDWQREATRTAISHNHQLNIQQGGKKSSTGAFLNYTDSEGIMKYTWNKRLNGRLVYDTNPYKWLSTAVNLTVNHTWGRYASERGGGQDARRTMIEMVPWLPVRDAEGKYTTSQSPSTDMSSKFGFEGMSNPVMILEGQNRVNYRTQIFGNAALTFHLMEGLDLKTQFGIDNQQRRYYGYSSVTLNNLSMPNGWANKEYWNTLYWQEETYLTYKKMFGPHLINAMAGLSWSERTEDYTRAYAEGFDDDFFQWNNLGSGRTPKNLASSSDRWAMNSYFLRLVYNYNNRYSATATGRYDGSSKFGVNNKYAFFPSAGLAWNINNEDFMQDVAAIDNLKLHTSFGMTGNSEISTEQSLSTFSSGTVLIDGSRQSSAALSRMPNPDLRWEKTAQFDIGVDVSLWKGRLTGEISYYHKNTTDLLLSTPIPYTAGFSSVYKNIGAVQNSGLELMITGSPIRTKDFKWDITLNTSYNKNKVTKLGDNNEDIELLSWVGGANAILRVGESINSFYGYRRLGVWTKEDYNAGKCEKWEVGRAHRTPNKEVLGKGTPDWVGSFINNFSYKNFDLMVDFQFVYGVETMQQFFHSTYDRFGITNGLKAILYDAYDPATGANANTGQQAIYLTSAQHAGLVHAGQDTQIDSQWIADASYLRLNNVLLGYNFDAQLVKSLGLSGLRVYLSGKILFLLHAKDFLGYDPESTSQNGESGAGQNITFFSFPRARTFTFGVNVTF